MHIHKIEVTNFRMLKRVHLLLDNSTTVIVGRNNSGKTSLTELFRRILMPSAPSFPFEDFSQATHEDFWTAYQLYCKSEESDLVRNALPIIETIVTVYYDKTASKLGTLSEFIVDINADCTEAQIVITYSLRNGGLDSLFRDIEIGDDEDIERQKSVLLRVLRERIPKCYATTVQGRDPNDFENTIDLQWSALQSLLHGGVINAQRGLDDVTDKDRNLLGKILEELLNNAMLDAADAAQKELARQLEKAVETMQRGIGSSFNKHLNELLPAFSLFGYPGLSDPGLVTETILDVKRLLTNHTTVQYVGANGINLPETYNGLGTRNLIVILLKLLEFFRAYRALQPEPGIHLIFIEEPEVHLHPQMQEVFISMLAELAATFAKTFNKGIPWPVQFVVTTHSSHIANRATFDAIRYFHVDKKASFRNTDIKDLQKGLNISPDDRDFLLKYMTLTRCDLFFADKAILIEGTTERLLLPIMIEKLDSRYAKGGGLSNQYLSTIEVGGTYADKFFRLLDFLELPTLIITDIDSAKKNENGKLAKCKVSEGSATTNPCIKTWFSSETITPAELLKKDNVDKSAGYRQLAYQIPEATGSPCGRSFEEAFILANPNIFPSDGQTDLETHATEKAKKVKNNKTDFALTYAIRDVDWVVPRYIAEGLELLHSKEPSERIDELVLSESLLSDELQP